MKQVFSFFNKIGKSIKSFLNEIEDNPELIIVLIMLGVIIVFVVFIFSLMLKTDTNIITHRYILQQNLVVSEYKCVDNDNKGCYLVTNKGNIETNINLDKDTKFDIIMNFGTCYNKLYLKVYKDDIVVPYEMKESYTFNKSSEEYKYYNTLYKIPNSKCLD